MTGQSCAGHHAGDVPAGIRVLVVDDHPWVRTALSEMLQDEDDVTVVGECEDGSQVVDAVARLNPDVVLMDLSMPVMDGLAATEALRALPSGPRIVVFTGEGGDVGPEVAAAGADALLPKTARAAVLLGCLRTVAVGCRCCAYCF